MHRGDIFHLSYLMQEERNMKKKCNASLNGNIWVTSCLHVFCTEHGTRFFSNNKIQVNCPVCNEVNVRESDTLLSHSNPHDMTLAGLRPEKIIRLVERSIKLWKCQVEAERRLDTAKIVTLSKQLEEQAQGFKQILHRREAEFSGQISGLQANYDDAMIKLQQVNRELEMAKATIRRYKVSYQPRTSSRSHLLQRSNVPDFGRTAYEEGLPGPMSNPRFQEFSDL